MTETPAPDPAAVRIAAEVIYRETALAMAAPDLARMIAVALARADRLCLPGTLARLSALEAVAEAARPHAAADSGRLSSALDALDAAAVETAPRCECDRNIEVSDMHRPYCPVAGTTAEDQPDPDSP